MLCCALAHLGVATQPAAGEPINSATHAPAGLFQFTVLACKHSNRSNKPAWLWVEQACPAVCCKQQQQRLQSGAKLPVSSRC